MVQVIPLSPSPADSETKVAREGLSVNRLLRLLTRLRMPDSGSKPPEMHIPGWVWKRHSALLMGIYENSGKK